VTERIIVPHLEIQLLGDFRLTYNGRILTEINTNRLQILLAYLLLQRNAPQPRRHIAFLFWPDTTEKQALSNLRTSYSRLRQKLPDATLFLRSDRQTIQWLPDAPFTLDVAEFEAAVSTAKTVANWQSAVDLYHAPILPGWYDEWLEPERERLRQLFLRAGETLLKLQENQRNYPAAIETAQQLLRHDPLHEPTYRRLMRLQALSGGKADALRTYHTCATFLEQELGVTPDRTTRDLYKQLLHSGLDPEPISTFEPDAITTPLVGRDEEWSKLKRAWQTVVRGRTGMVLISGEAGTGKSRLAAELLQWAQRQGIAAVATRSYEAEGELAYAPVLTWLRSPLLQAAWKKLDDITLTELARLLPELLVERLDLPPPVPLTQSWQRQRLFQALAQAVFSLDRPLLLHIDDLQWCDQETLEWLHYLLRFDPQAPLLLVGAYRPEEVDAGHPLMALQLALRRTRQLKQLELLSLEETDTAVLASQLAGRTLAFVEATRLYQETEGNPLFIIEMMRAHARGAGLRDGHELPSTIQATIQARFVHITPQARDLLSKAAVIGRAFDYDLLAQISGMSEDILVTRLDELWRRRIIREHGGTGYDFSHDKFREVAYAELSEARRRLLHRRVAQTLEAQHISHIEVFCGQIATHYEMADMPGEAIPHYQGAADTARKLYANAESISYTRRALRLLLAMPPDTPAPWRFETEVQLYETLGDLLHFSAQYKEAQEAYESAFSAVRSANGQDPIQQCRLLRKTGNACEPLHQYEAALQYFSRAEAALGQKPPASLEPVDESSPKVEEIAWWREWIELQKARKYIYYWLNRWPEIATILDECQPILTQYGTTEQQAVFFDPGMFYRRDRFTISDEVLGKIREWYKSNLELNDPTRMGPAHFSMGFSLLWHGDLAEAEKEMQAALEMTVQTGDVNLRARCFTYLTILYRRQELLQEVRTFAAQSEAVAKEAMMPEYAATARANLSWLAWREGDYQEARVNGRAALEIWGVLPEGHASCAFQWTALFPLLAVAFEERNFDEAIVCAEAILNDTQQKLPAALTVVLQNAATAHHEMQFTESADLLAQAITLAQQMRYL
jgi:DNA-binding SARP family transcriptional activator